MKPAQPPIVKISSPADIVAAIPSFVGFHPSESLVVMCLHGPRRRSGLTMRADLPTPPHYSTYTADLARRAAKTRADGTFLVCYTAASDAGADLPRCDLIECQVQALSTHDVDVVEALLVRDDRWWSYTCTRGCCPREGTLLPASPGREVARLEAERVLRGRSVLASRDQLEASVSGPQRLRRSALEQVFDRVADSFAAELDHDGSDSVCAATVALARSALDRRAEGRGDIEDAEAARIVIGLHDKLARDELITWALDRDAGELITFLVELAQRALDEFAAPVCTVLAAVAYQDGEGALAAVALERVFRSNPGYEMAGLLASMLDEQVTPSQLRALMRRVRHDLRPRAS